MAAPIRSMPRRRRAPLDPVQRLGAARATNCQDFLDSDEVSRRGGRETHASVAPCTALNASRSARRWRPATIRVRASRTSMAAWAANSSTISSGVGSATKATPRLTRDATREDHGEQGVDAAAGQSRRSAHRPSFPTTASPGRLVGDLNEPADPFHADVERPHRLEARRSTCVSGMSASSGRSAKSPWTDRQRGPQATKVADRQRDPNRASRGDRLPQGGEFGFPNRHGSISLRVRVCRNCTPWLRGRQIFAPARARWYRLSARMPILVTVSASNICR